VKTLVPERSRTARLGYLATEELCSGLGRTAFELHLNLASLTATSCESALLSKDPAVLGRNFRRAKKPYGAILRYASRLSFTIRDVPAFEWGTVRLENVISQIAQKHPPDVNCSAIVTHTDSGEIISTTV